MISGITGKQQVRAVAKKCTHGSCNRRKNQNAIQIEPEVSMVVYKNQFHCAQNQLTQKKSDKATAHTMFWY